MPTEYETCMGGPFVRILSFNSSCLCVGTEDTHTSSRIKTFAVTKCLPPANNSSRVSHSFFTTLPVTVEGILDPDFMQTNPS